MFSLQCILQYIKENNKTPLVGPYSTKFNPGQIFCVNKVLCDDFRHMAIQILQFYKFALPRISWNDV